MTRPQIVVVGGGLTGLATAWRLARDGVGVTLLEADDRLGGQIRTTWLAGSAMDVGADAVLVRRPEGERLLTELGFGDDLIAPATGRVGVWADGRVRPLPTGTVFGVPADLAALARAGVLSTAGLARAALEPVLPRRRVIGDRSVADLVGERFGGEVVDTLVEPLLGGVYAGAATRLSAAATLPAVWDAARGHRSVLAGLRGRPAPNVDGPVFLTVRGGLGRAVDRMADDLGDRARTGVPVVGLDRSRERWTVHTDAGSLRADQVVLALPPVPAARLLADVVPDAARELVGIPTASIGVVALAYDATAAAEAPHASGLLVPRAEGRLVKAVTLTSRKWPHHAGGDHFLVRASVGRVDDTTALDLDDDTLALRVDAEVRWAMGIRQPAVERTVVRWPDALPQYEVGHLERIDRLRAALAGGPPGLHVGGAGLDGVGLAARAADAERLTDEVGRVAAAPSDPAGLE